MEFGIIREPIVEGIFYPDEEQELHSRVRDLLRCSAVPAGNAAAVLVPHAGYDYCGSVIASGMKAAAAAEIRRVVVIGPVHRDPEESVYLPESGWFRTPLGLVTVDKDAVLRLESCGPSFVRNDIPHLEEHCIEVLLPFIQYLFPNAAMVPLLLGKPVPALVDSLADGLTAVFGGSIRQETLFVLSVNLTNYLESEAAKRESERLLGLILSCSGGEILAQHSSGILTTCGAGVLAAHFRYIGKQPLVEILDRGASCTTNRDRRQTVEYAAVSFT